MTKTTLMAVLVGAALVGCGGGAEKKADEKKADEKKDDEKKDDEKQAVEAKPAVPKLDCATYVTEADIKQACGIDTQQQATRGEGNHPLNACSRKFRGPDDRSISFKLAIHDDVAKVSSIPWKEGATGIPDLGDAAHTYVEDKGGQFDWHVVEVRFGEKILYLRSINATGAEPLCPTEKLTEVARAAYGRLASSQ